MKKTIITVPLLLFVGISLLVAVTDVAGWRETSSTATTASVADQASSSADKVSEKSRFTAIFFHAPHRCPTCKKIEAYAYDALSADIERGDIAWEVADYTADEHKSVVEQCEVLTSTVVLVDAADGQVARWKNLEEVWIHTDDREAFEAFIEQSWRDFREAGSS